MPSYAITTIVGDFNAKVGSEAVYRQTIGKESLHEGSNDKRFSVINFDNIKNLIVAIIFTESIHKQTWISLD